MTIIDKNGERKACDRCHKVRVAIKRGMVCDTCRAAEARLNNDHRCEPIKSRCRCIRCVDPVTGEKRARRLTWDEGQRLERLTNPRRRQAV